MDTTKYPMDYTQAKKGDVITAADLRTMFGYEPETKEYNFAVLRLRDDIERHLDAMGTPVTVAMVNGNLCVLNDAEASEYNAARFIQAKSQMVKAHWRAMRTVDAGALTADQLTEHQRRVEVQGKYIQALADTGRSLRAGGATRNTPGLPSRSAGA